MKKMLKMIPSVLCVLAILLSDISDVFAKTGDTPETAAKTVNIAVDEDDDNTDDAETEGEKEEKEAGDKVKTEDGESEKTDNYFIERPDPSEMTEVRISNYDEWCDFARKCSYDTWSADKYVVLADNIDCNMKKITPVPYFAGIFDGDGHTINRAAFTDEQNYIGVFSKTAPTAVIRNVNVIGVMKPGGKPFQIGGIVGNNAGMIANCKYDGYVEGYDYIGGIAGYNEASGIISACSVTGKVTGLHYVGGICGANSGLVTGCSASADINTVTKEVETGLKDIKVEEMFTALVNMGREDGNKKSIASTDNPVDIGGIVGHNIGEISSCVNESSVGYEHVGYNIGGVTGRSSGYVHDCTNKGLLNGRKDVGGIVGQAEPYIRLDLTKDIITQLSTSINKLHDSVDKTIKDTDASSGVVSARLNVIKSFADNALSDTGYLANSTTDFVNGVTGATNELVGRLEYVVSETSSEDGPMEDVEDAGRHLRKTAEELEEVVEDLDIDDYMTPAETQSYEDAKRSIQEKTEAYQAKKHYYETATDAELGVTKAAARTAAKEAAKATAKDEALKELYEEKHPGGDWSALSAADKQAFYDNELNPDEKAKVDTAEEEAGNAAVKVWAAQQANTDTGYADAMAENAATLGGIVLRHSDEIADNVEEDGKEALKEAKKMANDLKDAGKGMKEILRSVANSGAVSFPQLSDEYRMRTNSLVANIQGMSDNLGFLNNEMAGSTDVVCADLENVNDEFSTIMLLFTDAMDGVLDMDYSELYEDESDTVCETSVDATIADCTNYGNVYGDIDTGGIAGTMAEEYDFDLEGDITGVKDSAKNSTYRTKCVSRQNTNRGDVKGKKSYAGGVCGLHEIGTILRCANFAKAESESGDYVGGVAGRSYATITGSFEKGVLSGQSYIGGIAGSGATITDCVAMPSISEGTNFLGAIVGTDDDGAKLKRNVFVSDTLAGSDRISRAGAAEPISYSQLLALENIPSDYSLMRVDFIVDDKIVSSEHKKVGEVVTPSETPMEDSLELEDDEYVDWDCDEAIPVYCDLEIKGEKTRYQSSLASEQVRANKQSVFLVDGRFSKDDVLDVSALPGVPEGREEFILTIPKDGANKHTIRYQMPQNVEKVTIYIGENGSYEEVEYSTYGKFLTFEAAGDALCVRIDQHEKKDYTLWYIIGASALALVIIFLVLMKILRCRRNPAKSAKVAGKADKNEGLDIEELETEDDSNETQ